MNAYLLAGTLAIETRLGDNVRQLALSRAAGVPLFMTGDKENQAGPETGHLDSVLSNLIRRGKEGDNRALEEIYERYKSSFFNLAYRYTYDRVAAEDLLQEIFIKIFTHLQDVHTEETFVAWMYRIAVNSCYSYLRSKKSHESRTVAMNSIEGRKEEAVYDSHEGSLRQSLDEAVHALPDKLRAVFLLHDVQGFKHEEIARMLGIETGTSKSQLFKARMKIREFLKNKQAL
ncbi:MAG: RNA polymerase sigma factor [Clostridiales bacterium]|nr:RNA polymerase sigma factor [Clostridiales bacterium]